MKMNLIQNEVSTGNAVTGSERSELFPPYARMTKKIKRAYAREPVTAPTTPSAEAAATPPQAGGESPVLTRYFVIHH
jgi:hypothetical protein